MKLSREGKKVSSGGFRYQIDLINIYEVASTGFGNGWVGEWDWNILINSNLGKLTRYIFNLIITMKNNYMFYKITEYRIPLNLGIFGVWNLFTRSLFIAVQLRWVGYT